MSNNSAPSMHDYDNPPEDSRVTLCPQCDTAFRVTGQQLQLAAGQVRCGSCLHVFQAGQHWASDEDVATRTGTEGVAAAAPVINQEPPVPEDKPNPPARTMEFSDAFLELDGQNPRHDSLSEVAAASATESDDEEWARQILEDEESETRDPKNELLEAIMGAAAGADEQPGSGEYENTGPAASHYEQSEFQSTEGWMEELLGGEEAEAEIVPAAKPDPAPGMAFESEPDQEYVPEIFRQKKKLIDGIQADPLEMQLGRHISPGVRQWLTLLGIVLAALLLTAQYAWHNSERLARNPQYRALFTQFCQLTACTMPAAHDIANIKNSNLVVLKHPRTEDALLLDTIITNYAGFEQAFPRIQVEFSDLQDQVVASRIFAPGEYLRGDLVGGTMMPVRRPIHLSLELVDPGQRAVNYRIHLLPPATP